MSSEPYVVRRFAAAQMVPLVVGVAWFAFLKLAGLDFPTLFLVAVVVYVLASTALGIERLRVDAKGVRAAQPAASRGITSNPSPTAARTSSA